MIVVITGPAEDDLARIGDTIARDNPARALEFVRELCDKCEALADMPRRYPLVPRYESKGVRRCVYGNYLIFYRVNSEQVTIIHVTHGAMDYGPILFPDG